MSNGKKDSKNQSEAPKRVSDMIDEGAVNKDKADLSKILDKDITILKVIPSLDNYGKPRHVTIEYKLGKDVSHINIKKARVMEKLITLKDNVPFVGKITKGDRYFDIA